MMSTWSELTGQAHCLVGVGVGAMGSPCVTGVTGSAYHGHVTGVTDWGLSVAAFTAAGDEADRVVGPRFQTGPVADRGHGVEHGAERVAAHDAAGRARAADPGGVVVGVDEPVPGGVQGPGAALLVSTAASGHGPEIGGEVTHGRSFAGCSRREPGGTGPGRPRRTPRRRPARAEPPSGCRGRARPAARTRARAGPARADQQARAGTRGHRPGT